MIRKKLGHENPVIEKRDRYYVYLDDEAQCYRETYKVGDHLTGKDRATFEADKEEECRAYTQSLNEEWEESTKESLGIELSQVYDEVEDTFTNLVRLEHELGMAVGLVVKLNHEFILEGVQPAVAGEVEEFWNYETKKAIPNELLDMAHKDGLPISARELKQREEAAQRGCSDCPDSVEVILDSEVVS